MARRKTEGSAAPSEPANQDRRDEPGGEDEYTEEVAGYKMRIVPTTGGPSIQERREARGAGGLAAGPVAAPARRAVARPAPLWTVRRVDQAPLGGVFLLAGGFLRKKTGLPGKELAGSRNWLASVRGCVSLRPYPYTKRKGS